MNQLTTFANGVLFGMGLIIASEVMKHLFNMSFCR